MADSTYSDDDRSPRNPPVADSGIERSFQAALRAVESSPESDDAWQHLEELAEQLHRPDEVAQAYRRVLDKPSLSRDLFTGVAERAVQFHDEWFGETPERTTELLSRIIELDRGADWAFERATVMLTSAGQWDQLLDLHDRVIETAQDPERRRQLLDDAAQLAKDFADQPDRAAGYIQRQLALDPQNEQLVSSLERMLERQGRHRDLIDLWCSRIPELSAEDVRRTRVRIAVCWLDELGDPERALEALRTLVGESPGHAEGCAQLERILALESAEGSLRRQALSLLRKNYLVADRPDDVVRVLSVALSFVDPEERGALHRELGGRLAILGRDVEAMQHYAALVVADTSDADARKQLRQLARHTGRDDLHVQALVDAAAAAEAAGDGVRRVAVLLEAAQLYRTVQGDVARAVDLYTQVLESPDAEPAVALQAAQRLDELLAAAGRDEERLAVLERLAQLETSAAVRRHVLGEAARLAERLGDADRALASWRPLLDGGEHDQEALAAVVELLERNERHEDLIDVLRRRAAGPVLPLQRRADLIRVASLEVDALGRLDDAIATWLAVRTEFGESDETTAALDDLLGRAGRDAERAGLLAAVANAGHARAADLLARLGDIHRQALHDGGEALGAYRRALAIEPRHELARRGLQALVDHGPGQGLAFAAASALDRAYEQTDEWQPRLALLEARLGGVESSAERARLLREAADLLLTRGDDPVAALEALARALPLDPSDRVVEEHVLRLAARTGQWEPAVTAFTAAAEQADVPARAAQLYLAAARVQEERLGDAVSAGRAYLAAATPPGRVTPDAAPTDNAALEGVVRCAARARQWADAAGAAVRLVELLGRVPDELLAALEQAAAGDGEVADGPAPAEGWRQLAAAMGDAVTASTLRPALAAALHRLVAGWLADRAAAPDFAEGHLRRALEHDPNDVATLELLADLQRKAHSPQLVEILVELDRRSEASLDALGEAARLAVEQSGDPESGSSARARTLLERLYRKAAAMWMNGEQATGESTPAGEAVWSLEQLVAHHIQAGSAARAVHILLDGSRLPLDAATSLGLQRRAAEMLAEQGDKSRAIDAYRGVLDAAPDDHAVLQRVATLCEEEGRVSESLALRLRELELTGDVERRLQLRLDHARLTGMLEEQGGRVQSLLANLADVPGHERTIVELCAVLEERGKHEELSRILGEQAVEVEARGDHARAADLWARVAELAERHPKNLSLAIEAHGRVVALHASNASLDALARLHLERNEPAAAAAWLERRLQDTAPGERVAVLLQLARAQIEADRHDAAVASLEAAFAEAPRNAKVRKLLINLHRKARDQRALADTLSAAALHVSDEATVLAYAREAADIYRNRLGAPAEAVAVLRKAVELAPGDRQLESMLAEGLRLGGDLDGARTLLESLIASFGRRRSPERAGLHLQLAHVHHAQGRIDQAIDELDTASKMDAGNASILLALGERAQEAGQLERAERAYRTLLISVRRASPGEQATLPIGPSGVLLQLSGIAAERGQAQQSRELSESFLESLAQHDHEAPRVQAKLRERGEHALLQRVLTTRLGYVRAPHQRAEIFATLAELLEAALDQPEQALEARLEAIKSDPGSPVQHEAALRLARACGHLNRYVSEVEALLADERAEKSPHVRCELLLRLGEVLEKEREDLDRAAAIYAQAEATGARQVDVWRAEARIAAARGDEAEHLRLLTQLASLGEDQAETRADALYRLAEVQLASEATVEEGVVSLQKALADDVKPERAGLILRQATEAFPELDALLDLYEQVARRASDDSLTLHYLERRAAHPGASPEQVREAVELARKLGDEVRAEGLMLRAAEIGYGLDGGAGLSRVDWALLGLAERRKDVGDLAGAVKWLGEATEVADQQEVFRIGRGVAEAAAAPDGDLTLAAKLYERLLEREPTARQAWEPLAEIYRRLGDVPRLERMVDETLDGLQEPADRNALRVGLARALLADEARAADVTRVLQDVLVDDPEHAEAQALLVGFLERTGGSEELLELLRRQLDAALDREDAVAIRAASLRLGERLAHDDPEDALRIYRRALEHAEHDDRELLRAIVELVAAGDHDPADRAALTERLLRVEPDAPAGRALELAELYESLGDAEGSLRALRLGHERAPDHDELRRRLEHRYREQGDYQGLVATLLDAAGRAEDAAVKLALLREAAAVQRDHIGDAEGAVALLRQAFALAPDDHGLCIELASALSDAGDHPAALTTVSEALDLVEDDATARLRLLRARAVLWTASGDAAFALADLEDAFGIDPSAVAAELESTLQEEIAAAIGAGDQDAERDHTLRSVDVMLSRGKRDAASELLTSWVARAPDDVAALRRLRDIHTDDGRWDAVAHTCQRLVELETGSAQVDAALALSHAFLELGEPERARPGLEYARAQQPDNQEIRNELRKIYDHLQDHHALAGLLLEDARLLEDPEARIDSLLTAGRLYVELGDAASAIPALAEVLQLSPGDPATTVALADAYILTGDLHEAHDLLDAALDAARGRRTPETCLYYHRKGKLAEAQGDRQLQFVFLQDAHLSNKKNGEVAAELADLAEHLEEWDVAAKTLRTITLIDTESRISKAEAYLRQGRIAMLQGDEKSAKMWARRARREDTESVEIEAFLEELGERVRR